MGSFSRRGFFAFLTGSAGGLVVSGMPVLASREHLKVKAIAETAASSDPRTARIHELLQARLGGDIYSSWFRSLEFDGFDGRTVTLSVPVKFVRNWLREHYSNDLLSCCRAAFNGAEGVAVVWRQPGAARIRKLAAGA